MQSKAINVAVALAMLFTAPVADAACVQNADGTWTCSVNRVQGQPVRNVVRYAAPTVARVATAPARVVRYGLFGRARYSVAPQATYSTGSTGGYSQSYGSSGGTATYQSTGSSGGLGSYGDGPTNSRSTTAPVTKDAPAASVPLSVCPCGDDCKCGPDCQCQTQVCTVPAAAPSTRLCIVPPASVSSTCSVPSGLSVEAMASL